MEKKSLIRYFIIVIVLIALSSSFLILREGGLTSFVSLDNEEDEDKGFLFEEIDSLEFVELKSVEFFEDDLRVDYVFDNSNVIGDFVEVNIWIEDSIGNKIESFNDVFSANVDGVVERIVFFNSFEKNIFPFYLYFSVFENDSPAKYLIGSSDAAITGYAVSDDEENIGGFVGSFFLLLFILIGALFLIRKYGKREEKPLENESKEPLVE
jgi:hypothetical protein